MNLEEKKILLIGYKGILGSELKELLPEKSLELGDVNSDVSSNEFVDITNYQDLKNKIDKSNPDIVINCAAYTQVDLAESEAEKCFSINTLGVINLVKALEGKKAKLVHVSSDYVFGSLENVSSPISELQEPNPCGVYGFSKFLADQYILQQKELKSLIIRTSWLHGKTGPNFIKSIVKAAKSNKTIKVVNDQFGSPTWVPWLAKIITDLLSKDANGIFNVSSKGSISWHEFAKEIVEKSGIDCEVNTQSTEQLARPAKRPKYSVLDKSKLESFLSIECISWQECVTEHLRHSKI